MINEFKKLWVKKHDLQGRINITVYFVNIFLLLCHVFLMIVYLAVGNNIMIGVNIISLLLYSLTISYCYKNIKRYMGIVFLEIWLHMICGILSFGWSPSYQNWCFGMLTAYFLPAFNPDSNVVHKRSFHYTFLIIFSYFFLASFFLFTNQKILTPLNQTYTGILFIINNSFTFVAISLFTLFYTSSADRKKIELTRKADYDELTNLYNRHALNQISNNIISNSLNHQKSYSVAIIDIDHFKKVNDKYGHTSGDMVLKRIASIIKDRSINGIISGRWGGEEFVFLAPHNIDYDSFTSLLENLRIDISKESFKIENNKEIKLTISIGASEIKDYKDLEKAISIADVNLYKAKDSGRNKIVK